MNGKRIVRGIVTGCVGGKRAKKIIVRDVICESELLKVDIADELEYSEKEQSTEQCIEKIAETKKAYELGRFNGWSIERRMNGYSSSSMGMFLT